MPGDSVLFIDVYLLGTAGNVANNDEAIRIKAHDRLVSNLYNLVCVAEFMLYFNNHGRLQFVIDNYCSFFSVRKRELLR
jgi:hypothetical protein